MKISYFTTAVMVLSTYCQYATTCKCKRFPKKTVLNLKKQCRQKENNVNENVPIADNMDKFLEGLLLKTNETLIKYENRSVTAVSENHRSSSQLKLPVFKKGNSLNSLRKNVAEGLKVFYFRLLSMEFKEQEPKFKKSQKLIFAGEIREVKNYIVYGLCLFRFKKVKISRKKSQLTKWKKLAEYQTGSLTILRSFQEFLKQVKKHSRSMW
ncbi:uncharacterized protein [Mytilus edulis]|uniref:uncharacterized protein n=1 Tax=Mytilus edulis TaxID=6550 RepID=UPI0039EF6B2A